MKAEWVPRYPNSWFFEMGRVVATVYKSPKRDFVVFLVGRSGESSRHPTLAAAQAAAQEAVLAHLRAEVAAVEAMGKGGGE